MSIVQIFGFPQSNYVWTTRIAAAEKGVPHEFIEMQPHTPVVEAVHPFGKVPVLKHGEFSLAESRAICAYLDIGFDGPALMPRSAREAAVAEQWISLITTTIEPVAIRQYFFGYVRPDTADAQPDRSRIEAALPQVGRALAALARGISSRQLVGDAFTLADAFLIPNLYYLQSMPETGETIRQSAPLRTYLSRQMERKSVEQTAPPPMQ